MGLCLVAACGGSERAEPSAAQPEAVVGTSVAPEPTGAPASCAPEKLAALVQTLAPLDARTRRNTVARELPGACRLPSAVKDYIALRTLPDDARGFVETEGSIAARQDVCPNADAVWKEVGAVPPDERAAIIYDRCDLRRFELITRGGYTHRPDLSIIPFYLYEWLTKEAVPDAQARALAKALALLGRQDWRRAGQTLPLVESPLPVVPPGLTLSVMRERIELQEVTVTVSKDGVIDPTAFEGRRVAPVFRALTRAVEESERSGGPVSGPVVVVVADAATPYATIRDLAFTADRAGLSNLALVAEASPLEFGAVPVSVAHFGSLAGQPTFALRIDERGLSVGSDAEGTERIDGPADAPWDLAALAHSVAEFKKTNPKAVHAAVGCADGVPYAALVRVLAALRGPRCESASDCALPKVRLELVPGGAVREPSGFGPDDMVREAGILGKLATGTSHFDAGSEVGEANGVGGLGLVGDDAAASPGLTAKHGDGTTGVVRPAKATVKGALSGEVVRDAVAENIDDVRECYEEGLAHDATLAGRVKIQFVINDQGKVPVAVVVDTTVKRTSVGNCIAKVIKTWKLPKPAKGNVVVTYPFVLSPG